MIKDFIKAAGIRAVKTFLQVVLAIWTAGELITDVDWHFVLVSAVSAAIYSVLTSILAGLPEVALLHTVNALDNDPEEEDELEEEGDE